MLAQSTSRDAHRARARALRLRRRAVEKQVWGNLLDPVFYAAPAPLTAIKK
jgi:hypothetical protein